jgi:transcriptional regulator with GAF, ATPase, and Fis domain
MPDLKQTADTRSFNQTVRYACYRLAVASGVDAGQQLQSAGTTVRIGTAAGSDLRLSDATVSREHCEIELNETGFRIRDLGSKNGIRVGGLRVFDISGNESVELRLGETVLSVTPLASAETRERASDHRFGDLLGESSKMRELFAILSRVAPTDLSVLIEGETGTGKELVAHSIHRASARANGPFVVFDCSAVTPSLIESDLFGHERGAFTGATGARPGALAEANGGTLFLDELGELPLDLQQKLLRCLQSGEFKRVGATRFEKTDVRVIAATHRDLRSEIQAGRFRQDLFYRLEGVAVHVPPLRERVSDLPQLVLHFIKQTDATATLSALPEGTLEMFRAHRWPGNVRELRNAVRRLQILPELAFMPEQTHSVPLQAASTRPSIDATPTLPAETEACACAAHDLVHAEARQRAAFQVEARVLRLLSAWRDSEAPQHRPDWLTLEDARRELSDAFELDYLALLKRQSGAVKSRAANWAGVSRQAIQKLVRKHALDWSDTARDEAI